MWFPTRRRPCPDLTPARHAPIGIQTGGAGKGTEPCGSRWARREHHCGQAPPALASAAMDSATFDCPTVAYVEEPVLVAQLGIWSADGVLEIATVEGQGTGDTLMPHKSTYNLTGEDAMASPARFTPPKSMPVAAPAWSPSNPSFRGHSTCDPLKGIPVQTAAASG